MLSGDNCIIKNSILWANYVDVTPEDLRILGPSIVADLYYSDVDVIMGTLNIDADNIDSQPLFVDATNDDFHLQSISPCVDSGDGSVAPLTDIEGVTRNDDGNGLNNTGNGPPWVDMGAYEYD